MNSLLVLGSILCFVSLSDTRDIKMGIFLPFTGSWAGGPKMASAILIAIDKVNSDPYWLQGHNLTFKLRDSKCEAKTSLAILVDYYTIENPKVDVYIGPGCSVGCVPGAYIAAHWNIPMISWGCAASVLSDKTLYPYFVRTAGTFTGLGDILRAFLAHYNWDRIGFMTSTETVFSETANSAKVTLEQDGRYSVPFFRSFVTGATDLFKLKSMVMSMAAKTRVFMLLCYSDALRSLLLILNELGLLNGDYVVVVLETLYASCQAGDDRDDEACKAYEGIIDISMYIPESQDYKDFTTGVYNRMPEMNYTMNAPNETNIYAAYLHDAILLYAYALNESLTEGVAITEGANVSQSMFGKQFVGVSGPVGINEKGDRAASYRLQSFLPGISTVRIANFFGTTGRLQFLNQTIRWPGGTTKIPLGRPACGFDNEFCQQAAKGKGEIYA